MTRFRRQLLSALCALVAFSAASAAPVARAQTAGAHLLEAVTESAPAPDGTVAVDDVAAFDAGGGLAIFEPGGPRAEAFSYSGIDAATDELTGLARTTPQAHAAGTFVQAINDGSPSPAPRPSATPTSTPRARPSPSRRTRPHQRGRAVRPRSTAPAREQRDAGDLAEAKPAPLARWFDSARLTAAAARLYALRWSEQRVTRILYRPFPVAGASSFSDTWGAPRYGPAPGQVRRHEGEDIFCDFGAPLLAVTPGRIQFDTDGLGGRIARLHRPDGSYWYYAHLSRWNKREHSSGDRVERGDVIGYCGHSGDAATTPNHLHFGWYGPDGHARDPMSLLLRWLRDANRKSGALVTRATKLHSRTMRIRTLGRMFGDSWAPDLTEAPAP